MLSSLDTSHQPGLGHSPASGIHTLAVVPWWRIARHHRTKVNVGVIPGEVGSPGTAQRSRDSAGAKDGIPPPPEHISLHKGRSRLGVLYPPATSIPHWQWEGTPVLAQHLARGNNRSRDPRGRAQRPGKGQPPCSLFVQDQTCRETRRQRTLLRSPDGPRRTTPLGC